MSKEIKKEKERLKAEARILSEKLKANSLKLVGLQEIESGERPTPSVAKLIKTQPFSYGVHFERRKVLKKVASPGAICVSVRRFTSRKEADQHGKRFAKKHSHRGYDVVRVNKRANAWINWETGKTNPAI